MLFAGSGNLKGVTSALLWIGGRSCSGISSWKLDGSDILWNYYDCNNLEAQRALWKSKLGKECIVMSTSMTYFIVFCCVFLVLTWAAYIPFRAGLLYNGTVYCMAIGGYFAGFAAKTWNWPFWACVLGAMIVGAILGFIPALGFSRTSGVVNGGITSMALIFIVQSVIRTGFPWGSRGISGIP
jgi:hypothetical protein